MSAIDQLQLKIKMKTTSNPEAFTMWKLVFKKAEVPDLGSFLAKITNGKKIPFNFDVAVKTDAKADEKEEKLTPDNYSRIIQSATTELKLRIVEAAAPQEEPPITPVMLVDGIRQVLDSDLAKTFILRKINAKTTDQSQRIRQGDKLVVEQGPDFDSALREALKEAFSTHNHSSST